LDGQVGYLVASFMAAQWKQIENAAGAGSLVTTEKKLVSSTWLLLEGKNCVSCCGW
jgi:hypothetical protein